MELCDGDLNQKLKEKVKSNKDGHGFTEREIYLFLTQIIQVFQIMNLQNIMHRDIKLENILVCNADVDLGFIVKLSDYGISKIFEDEKNLTCIGSPQTIAPEVLKRENYNELADIWSLGAILYKLIFNIYPYKPEELLSLTDTLKFPFAISSDLKDLLSKILKKDPKARLNLSGITSHPFFISNLEPKPRSEYGSSIQTNFNSKIKSNQVMKESYDYFEKNKEFLKCTKCRAYLYDPRTCSECGFTFCSECILANKNSCPDSECNSNVFDLELKKPLREKLTKVSLHCVNGCGSKDVTMLNYKEHLEKCNLEHVRENVLDISKERNFDMISVNSNKYAQSKKSEVTVKTNILSKIRSKQVHKESTQAFEEYKSALKCTLCREYLYGPKTCSECKKTFCDDCVQKKKDSCPNIVNSCHYTILVNRFLMILCK